MRATVVPDHLAGIVSKAIELGMNVASYRDGGIRPDVEEALALLLGELRFADAEHVGRSGIPLEARPAKVPDVTTASASHLLGVSPRSVRGLAERGSLPGLPPAPGRRGWLFDRDDLAAFAARRSS